jgi:hypothetical protein
MREAKKAKKKTFIRTLSQIKDENCFKRRGKNFKPMPNKFFSDLSQYQKCGSDFKIIGEKPTLSSSISYVETILNNLINSSTGLNVIV